MKKYTLTFGINYQPQNWRVPGIKVIREFTGLGLKEAKDIHDSMSAGAKVTLLLNANQVAQFAVLRELSTSYEFPLIIHSLEVVNAPTHIDVSHINK